jgi:hypothetical protein
MRLFKHPLSDDFIFLFKAQLKSRDLSGELLLARRKEGGLCGLEDGESGCAEELFAPTREGGGREARLQRERGNGLLVNEMAPESLYFLLGGWVRQLLALGHDQLLTCLLLQVLRVWSFFSGSNTEGSVTLNHYIRPGSVQAGDTKQAISRPEDKTPVSE